jgi:hypothetical protein
VTARTPHRSAAQIIEIGRQYPSTLGDGERALIVEVESMQARVAALELALELGTEAARIRIDTLELELARAFTRHQVFEDAAYRWREKWIAAVRALAQIRGELDMNVVQLAGYRKARAVGEPDA